MRTVRPLWHPCYGTPPPPDRPAVVATARLDPALQALLLGVGDAARDWLFTVRDHGRLNYQERRLRAAVDELNVYLEGPRR
jgi:hypothetical protein